MGKKNEFKIFLNGVYGLMASNNGYVVLKRG